MNNRFETQVQTNQASTHIPIIDLPWIYRIIHLEEKRQADTTILVAHLYHDKASLSVALICDKPAPRLSVGQLVEPRWSSKVISRGGQVIINRLIPVERPTLLMGIFETVPYEWMMHEREAIQDANQLVSLLPDYFIQLFHAIFWDHNRFYRFITGPSSLKGHHNWQHGNFIHTVEVAREALKLCAGRPLVNTSVLITAALLHDAAKADEYDFNCEKGCFEISDRGALIGHKLTIIEWVATAIAQHQIKIPEDEYLGLMHVLSAVKGAPSWIGLREPKSAECNLLSMADRLSGQDDLFEQVKPNESGFGRFHKHLRGRPYVLNHKPR